MANNLLDDILPDIIADVFPSLTGRPVTLRRTVKGTYDPITETEGEDVVTPYEVTSITPLTNYEDREVNGTTIRAGDAQISIAASGLAVVPEPQKFSVVIGTAAWNIVRVLPLNTGERDALYTLHVRQ